MVRRLARAGVGLAGALVLTLFLSGCMPLPFAQEVGGFSGQDAEALDALRRDPLLAVPPPGTGDPVGADFPGVCDLGGVTRAWVLLDDGADALRHYRRLAAQEGWEVVADRAVEPDSPAVQDANLLLRRTSQGYAYGATVDIGPTVLADGAVVTVTAALDRPGLC